jgi:beta-catenin-like protein 1
MGGNKRRMPDAPTSEMLKRMKLDSDEAAAPQPNGGGGDAPKPRKVTVEDALDEDVEMAEEEEDFAPGGDADYFAEEDEEGRFYGGGLTSEQKEILNIFDKAGDGDEVRVQLLYVEKSVLHAPVVRGTNRAGSPQALATTRARRKQELGPTIEIP